MRQRDKWIPLPEEEESGEESPRTQAARSDSVSPSVGSPPALKLPRRGSSVALFEDLPSQQEPRQAAAKLGRITLYCTADRYDRAVLDELLSASFPASAIRSYPDVFYIQYWAPSEGDPAGGDAFIFDHGTVAFWGLTHQQEATLLRDILSRCAVGPLHERDFEVDQLRFAATAADKPHISNDVITLHRRSLRDHKAKLAISYALAQSTKLSLHERRVLALVGETRSLPEALAAHGHVHLPHGLVAKLIGRVFIEKSAVNLLTPVLDTPEFFWLQTSDALQGLYERLCSYLELDARVEVVNERFSVLQDLLDMLRDHENNVHSVRLTAIVIVLIVVCCGVGVLQVAAMFGLIGES